VKALIKTADGYGYSLEVLKAVEDVNDRQKHVLFAKAMKYFNKDLKGKTFAIWGLSFKPQTDDMREAPSLVIINNLLERGAKVKAYDPVAMEETKRILGDKIEYVNDQYEALIDADGLFLVTEWPEFKFPNFNVMSKLLNNKVIFDGRNVYDVDELKADGYDYFGIGTRIL
jgi:UDPglucose 6-dehydrogenase